jgi:RNA polymerase sigma-70 factor (ECF subfamily)
MRDGATVAFTSGSATGSRELSEDGSRVCVYGIREVGGRRLAAGDEQLFRELYDRTYERVFAFVMRRASEDSVDDIVAETYTAVWRRVRDLPADHRMADAWVFATAFRVLANARRGNRRRTALIDRVRQRPVDLLVDFSSNSESDGDINRALEHLRPEQREILALRFWDDLDTEQIARIMGCSKNAAAVRLSRAQKGLRLAIEALAADRIGESEEGVSDE